MPKLSQIISSSPDSDSFTGNEFMLVVQNNTLKKVTTTTILNSEMFKGAQGATGATGANGSNGIDGSTGASAFLDLTDVDPTSYAGQAGKSVIVNAVENGLEFGTAGSSITYISTNTTKTVKATGGDYTTLQAAWNDLGSTLIAPNAILTIELDDGTHATDSTINIKTHPCSKNIVIKGKTVINVSITSVVSSTTIASEVYTVTLAVSSVTNLVVNDYMVVCTSTGGTNPQMIRGCSKITNIDTGNSRITISLSAKSYSSLLTPSGAVTATGYVNKSVITCNATNTDYLLRNYTHGITYQNIIFDSTTTTTHSFYNVGAYGAACNINYCGFTNFSDNGINNTGLIYILNSAIAGRALSANTIGLNCITAHCQDYPNNIAINGCGVAYDHQYGARFSAANITIICSGEVFRAYTSTGYISAFTVSCCNKIMYASRGSQIHLESGACTNTVAALHAEFIGQINALSSQNTYTNCGSNTTGTNSIINLT